MRESAVLRCAQAGPRAESWAGPGAGAAHLDLYDRKEYVDAAVDRLAGFFAANLASK